MSTSIFEIIGPVMIGPSSSHTAGMARIGMMANRIAGFAPSEIGLTLSPTLKTTYHGHRTDAALIGGAMGLAEDDPQLKQALSLAEARGVQTKIDFFPPNVVHPNTAQLTLCAPDGAKVIVKGVSIGGGSIVIDAVDEQELRLLPEQYHILAWGEGAKNALDAVFSGAAFVQKGSGIVAASFLQRPDEAVMRQVAQTDGISKYRFIEPALPYGATLSEQMRLTRFDQIVETCKAECKTLDALALEYESERAGRSEDEILRLMQYQLDVMKASAEHGLYEDNEMLYGLTSGRDGKKLLQKHKDGKTISGGLVPYATAIALGVMEYNASMGRIVAAPTAGSAGIVPGCLLSAQEQYAFSDEKVIRALLVSALVGVVMAHREVSFSGSVGGCQGEVGVSSAMAAAGLAALFTEDPQAPFEAMAICMKNLLGLVCDPIAGPIEVPCIKRNAVGVANAFISAEMALAGIESYVPPDQVVDALIDVERRLPGELRCTTTGGLACTQKAVCLRAKLAAQSAT